MPLAAPISAFPFLKIGYSRYSKTLELKLELVVAADSVLLVRRGLFVSSRKVDDGMRGNQPLRREKTTPCAAPPLRHDGTGACQYGVQHSARARAEAAEARNRRTKCTRRDAAHADATDSGDN